MSDWQAKYKEEMASRRQKLAEKEQALLSGKDHKLLDTPKDVTSLSLDDETDISQPILEFVAANFPCLEELDISIEYYDYAPKLTFQVVSFPKLKELSLHCVGLSDIDFQKDRYPCLKSITLDNIGGEVETFRLDLPTLESFSAEFVTLNNASDFGASINRCTNLQNFRGYKLWGLAATRPANNKLYLPNCEEFDVYRSDDLEYLEIYAPKLRKLNLQACYGLDHIRIVDEPFGRPVKCFCCGKEEGPSEVASSVKVALLKCAKCKIAQYCSKECQTKDWDNHKAFCGKRIHVNVVNANIGRESLRLLKKHLRVKKVYSDGENDAMDFLELF